jgi:hypothetical protein
MSSPEESQAPAAASGSQSLFEGDAGELPLETRQAIVQLLLGPSIDGRRQQKLWATLLRDEQIIRSRLSELFLALVIDAEVQVAFTRQVQADGIEVPRLLRRSQLTLIDSVLLVHLRERLARAEVHGERAAVSEAEMLEDLALYERAASTDHAGFVKRASAAIEKVKKNSILHKIRGSDSRYEISPTLKLLFSVDQLYELKARYFKLAEAPVDQDREAEAAEEEE